MEIIIRSRRQWQEWKLTLTLMNFRNGTYRFPNFRSRQSLKVNTRSVRSFQNILKTQIGASARSRVTNMQQSDNFLSWCYFESVIKGEVALAAYSVLTPIPVWHILVLFSNREESKRAVLAQLIHSYCILKSVYSYGKSAGSVE